MFLSALLVSRRYYDASAYRAARVVARAARSSPALPEGSRRVLSCRRRGVRASYRRDPVTALTPEAAGVAIGRSTGHDICESSGTVLLKLRLLDWKRHIWIFLSASSPRSGVTCPNIDPDAGPTLSALPMHRRNPRIYIATVCTHVSVQPRIHPRKMRASEHWRYGFNNSARNTLIRFKQ